MPKAEKASEPVFTKEQILDAKKYRHDKDVVSALLKDGERYTISEVDAKIEKFMKGKVK